MDPPSVAKLATPRISRTIARPRVLKAMERALRDGHCWIAAPGGYGKTTALVTYLQTRGEPHIWCRVDEGDQDIASFFHDLKLSLPGGEAAGLPLFGVEYANQPEAFARRFFRAYFAALPAAMLLVLDDLHAADSPAFRRVLAVLLQEVPHSVRCICAARTMPPPELEDLALKGGLTVLDQTLLQFTASEAQALVRRRLGRDATVDVAAARGWAVGLVLLAEGGRATSSLAGPESAMFDSLGRQLFDTLPAAEQQMLLMLSLLPEPTPALAAAMARSYDAPALLERLHQRQLLVTRGTAGPDSFRLHDLLREFLARRLAGLPPHEQVDLRRRAAEVLDAAGHVDAAIDVALKGGLWELARRLIADRADEVLAQGRRATLIEWCAALPSIEEHAWLCYWLGVAHMADDAAAVTWLSRAWELFCEQDDARGQCLAVARAVLVKTDSWRTHEGLALWTMRAMQQLDRGLPDLAGEDELMVLIGMLRALDFAPEYSQAAPAETRLLERLLERLAEAGRFPPSLRLLASEALIEHAGSSGQSALFEAAVDSVVNDLADPQASPWALGLWLVAFGAASGRYFTFSRRGFPYPTPEAALRTAISIGEDERLRGVEFGGLYHLQLQMKLRNEVAEFEALVARLAQIADSRNTTQVAVVADCEAALCTLKADLPAAHRACERFMSAIAAADEPPIERWPHFITKFQVLLADQGPTEAADFLGGLAGMFDGATRLRTDACMTIAAALAAKRSGHEAYPDQLRAAITQVREASWSAVLPNLPDLLAELCADALDLDVEPAFCRTLIHQRRLRSPARRPRRWPWRLKIHVLGEFRLEIDGAPLDLGPKPPTRALDIVRALAMSRGHDLPLETLCDWLWPDAEGDRARAACEQSLHRLRKLLGRADLIVQREGRLRLASEYVWVDLDDWDARVDAALALNLMTCEAQGVAQTTFDGFPGPPRADDHAWSLQAPERLRGKFVELARRLGAAQEAAGRPAEACAIYLRALDRYPNCAPLHEALIRGRIGQADTSGAIEDFIRYERMMRASSESPPSASIRALVRPLLDTQPPLVVGISQT
ncbi:hypothetical protein LJR225_004809 [Phenylobacterium sp. LjRoot225]|uniref:hypothetical protein n=1 Tax=Phenylobacterium sp. LjRoot225 TaxID=3342285 RepID=UPI003ECC9DC3